MQKYKLSLLAIACGTILSPNIFAQEVETITVTATRYKQDPDKIPGSISVLKSAEIERQLSVSDDITSVIAKLVPGMTPSRQKLSNQGENFRGRTALTLVDGVPQNNPLRNGNRYGYTVDSSMLERIEVVPGASAVQGMGATGGIINYVTKSAKQGDNWKQTIGTRLNSNFRKDGTGGKVYYNLSQHDEDYDLFVGGAWQRQGLYYDGNGNPVGMNPIQGETQDSTSGNFLVKAGYNFDDARQRVSFSVSRYALEGNHNYVAIKGDHINGIPGTVVEGKPAGLPTRNDVKSYSMTYNHYDLYGGELELKVFKQDYEALFGEANWWGAPNQQKDQGAILSGKQGFKLSYSQTDILGLDDNWVVGIDGLEDNTKQTLIHSKRDVTPDMGYQGLAPFIQGDFLAMDDLRISTGVRYENTKISSSNGKTLWGYGNGGHREVNIIGGTQEFSQGVFNIGAVYELSDNLNASAGFSQGFGLPDIGRILRGNWIGGPNVEAPVGGKPIDFNTMPAVKPVVTDNYEVGLNYDNGTVNLAGSYYTSIAKNNAELALNSGGTYDVRRQRTDIDGVEFKGGYQFTENTSVMATYAHVEGKVDTNQDGVVDSDRDLKNLSPDRLFIMLSHSFSDSVSANLQYNHLFSRKKQANGAGAAQEFKGYGLVDLSVRYDMGKNGRLNFGIENLLDTQYINYFSQIRNHSSYYFAGRGRTFSVNYEISF
ncbi:TonB-dependent receptor [Paraferrimonas sp. SM1919]|uniref:TonB-dependent receptor n=1 Tax=Paraferrimonas sp. SM1919 TaxID=2662263 RepID=UPI0013D4A12D|nr:TonB-dependent receptor [Paraferrimonas sp. SM1919]